jgi:hypothetical protein
MPPLIYGRYLLVPVALILAKTVFQEETLVYRTLYVFGIRLAMWRTP